MSNLVKIVLLAVLTTLFYWYVGQLVPQKETYPPVSTEIRTSMSIDEMVAAGQEVFTGKGTCTLCHTIGSHGTRAPDLAGVGGRASVAKEGYSDIDYLAESLYDPGEEIVDGYNPIMTPANKAPINLTELEILAVIAYLQSLGGTPSITPDTKLKYFAGVKKPVGESEPDPAIPGSEPAIDAPAEVVATVLNAEDMMQKYLCFTCHDYKGPTQMLGPSLYNIGAIRTKGEIYESIIDPDAVLAEGYPPGVMIATLNVTGFYEQVTPVQLKMLVDFLAERKGE